MRDVTLAIDAEANASTRTRSEAWGDLVSAEAIRARVLRRIGKPLAPPYGIELIVFTPEPDTNAAQTPWPRRADTGALIDATLRGLAEGRLIVEGGHVVSVRATSNYSRHQPHTHVTVRSFAHRYPLRRR